MWTKSGIESEGQYAFSCEILRTLRFIYEIQVSDQHPWRKTIDNILKSFLLDFKSISRPKEAEVTTFFQPVQILFGMIRGCDFNGLAPFMNAVTSNKDKIQIIGFVNKNWIQRQATDSQDLQKVHEDFSNKDLKVLGVLYNEKHKDKCEYQVYDPNDIKLTSETAPTHSNSQMVNKQFKITAEILNRLLEDCDLLSQVDEDDIGEKQLDIFNLNTRTMIMKLINHQLQHNSKHFLEELKASNFYSQLLRFVCKESSLEMKGDIMLLEWLEYRCFAMRKYACENQQSLVKQREVHVTVVKDRLYVSFQHPILKGENQLNRVNLISAINYKNFEEKSEVKLINCQDVFINTSNQQQQAQKQIVLIDPESLARSNGLDIINACQGAITYKVDLNKLVKQIFVKQREDRDKYLELAQKTIFLVSEEDYRKIVYITQSSTFKRSATVNKTSNQNSKDKDDSNFDQLLVQDLIDYGGFHPFIAKKTLEKDTVEAKTEHLVQLAKQLKEGLIEVDDTQGFNNELQLNNLEQFSSEVDGGNQNVEECSEPLIYLKTTFQQYMERAHGDHQEKSTKDALYDAINSFSKKDLAAEYEKSLIRLFNMYCRHVFWSLIQKDDIETIFSMVLETENDMKSLSVFLKVLGNECFITGNKVYIKGYKNFLKKVVDACCKIEKFRPLLSIIIEEGIINSYHSHMEELKGDTTGYSTKRIEEYFKTESKAAQLMNPFIIVPLIRQILNNDPSIFDSQVDRLVSILISINCLFIGNYKLKDQFWELIVSLLEKVKQRIKDIPQKVIRGLLRLKVVEYLFKDFDEQGHYEREESEYVRRILKDNGNNEIDGISRRDIERLVYAKRALCLQYYMKYHGRENYRILVEMLYKFYQIDREFSESHFHYKNNIMTHADLYSTIIEQGKEGKLNEYLLFYNKLEDAQKISTHHFETNHKQNHYFKYSFREFEGSFVAKFDYPKVSKILVKVNDTSNLRSGSAIVISSDKEGVNVQQLIFEQQLKKDLAFKNLFVDKFYLHYPVQPSAIYQLYINEENPQPQLIEQPLYRLLDRYEEHSFGKFVIIQCHHSFIQFLTKGNKAFVWRNEELRRYKDHLAIEQFNFGKQCRVMLLKNGKVYADGRSKCRHLVDQEGEQSDVKGVEIPFYDKKDRITQISSFFQVTIATTEKGKIFAVGDKLAKIANEEPKVEEKKPAEPIKEEQKQVEEVKAEEQKQEENKEQVEQVQNEQQQQQPVQEEQPAEQPAEPVQQEPAQQPVDQWQQLQVFQHEIVIQVQVEEPVEEQQQDQQNQLQFGNPQQVEIVQQQQEEQKQVEEQKEEVPEEEQQQVIPEQNQEEQKQEEIPPPEVNQVNDEVQVQQQQEEEVKQENNEEQKVEAEPAQDSESKKGGEEELEAINTDSKPEKGEYFAVKVWACKTANAKDYVFLALIANLKTNKTELRTIGESQYGNLGQGPDVKLSTTFRKIALDVELRSLNDVTVGYDHTIIISKDNKVYQWGSYSPEDKYQYKPVEIPFFRNYNVIKIASNQKTVALVTPKDQPDRKLIIVGKFSPFVSQDTYKIFDQFANFNIYNIQPYGDRIIVSTQGTYEYMKPIKHTYLHSKPCEICMFQINGLLHFFKDKENNFHYFCIKCMQNGKMNEKYQPDIMWAIKRPINDLENKPWPEYDSEALLSSESRNTTLYLTRYKINGKEIEQQYQLEDIIEPSSNDMNPMIYMRISRPLKDDSKIDFINTQQFYEQTQHYGISLNITPDYGFNEQHSEIITKNQQVYDDFQKAMKEIEKLEPELQVEFKAKIEEFVGKKIKDQNISDVKYQEIVFTDQLKFKSDKLNELSDDCKKYYIGRFVQYLQYVWGSYTYISTKVQHSNDFSLLQVFNANRQKIPLILKNKILKKLIEHLPLDDQSISIHVNRKKAREFFETGKADEKGDYTIFAQVQKGLVTRNYQGLRINQSDKKAWFVKFIGEFALDQGGLFRESLTELCQELQSHVLNLLIPTQNQKNNHGENRDKWTLNPGANSPTQLKMLEFLGALIGMSVRSGILMSLNLPAFFWKQLTQEEVTLRDLKEIDTMTVSILEDLRDAEKKMTEEAFAQGYEFVFTTILSNAEEVELMPGGRKVKVNFSNLKQYIEKTIEVRLNECKKQIKAIKKGINITFDVNHLKLLNWQDLEYKVVGKDIIDIERLKELTVYRNCNDQHDTIKKFWKIMNAFTNEEKTRYLKFVWGRTRLPLKEEEITENHTVQMDENSEQTKLPVGRTCFFRLEIPGYKNEEVFREKLLYAITNCIAIDADIEGAVQNEEEHEVREPLRNEEDNDEEDNNSSGENQEGGLFGDEY